MRIYGGFMLRNIGYVISFVLFLLFLYYVLFALPLAVQDAPHADSGTPEELGAIGEYLGYLVGVPAAIGGALAAVAIALNTDAVAKRQLQLEAAKYRDAKTDEIKDNIRDFAEKLQGVRRTGEQLARRIGRLRGDARSTAEFIELAAEDVRVNESFERITDHFDALSRSILNLASNEIIHACLESQRAATHNRIRDSIENFWGKSAKFGFERDILDIRDKIVFLQQDRTVEDAAAAMLLMPADFHTLDFIGAFIKIADRHDRLATELLQNQALGEGDELLNYGLALLAFLYQLLPSDQTISDTIARIYNIRDLRLRPAAKFKAREVYFSRSTVDVINQAIDGERLLYVVKSSNVVAEGSVGFRHDNISSKRRRPTVEKLARAAHAMFGRAAWGKQR